MMFLNRKAHLEMEVLIQFKSQLIKEYKVVSHKMRYNQILALVSVNLQAIKSIHPKKFHLKKWKHQLEVLLEPSKLPKINQNNHNQALEEGFQCKLLVKHQPLKVLLVEPLKVHLVVSQWPSRAIKIKRHKYQNRSIVKWTNNLIKYLSSNFSVIALMELWRKN